MAEETKEETLLGGAPAADVADEGTEIHTKEGEKKADDKAEPEAKAKPAAEEKKEEPAEKKAEEKPAKVVPEKYELKLPENSLLAQGDLDKIAAIAKQRGLSQEEADALVNERNQLVTEFQAQQVANLKTTATEWLSAVEADPEIGGQYFKRNAELAKRVVARYATPEFRETLNNTGLGNHPELVRFLVRVGKSMSEDQLVPGKGNPAVKERIEDRWYGTKTA